MNRDKLNKINEWIWTMEEDDDIQPSDTAFGKSFGFIEMMDGDELEVGLKGTSKIQIPE